MGLSRKTPRLFAFRQGYPGIKVRTKWQSSPALGDNAERGYKGKPPDRQRLGYLFGKSYWT